MAGESSDGQDMECDFEGERDPDNIHPGSKMGSMTRKSDAILQAAAERVVQSSKTHNDPSRPLSAKFGATTLLGAKGFKLLREMGGKHLQLTDNPIRDLDTLMKLYRDWTRTMYPKFQFRDTIDKIERNCRTAPMKAYLSALWRASETDNGEEGTFDELQYVAEQSAREAMEVINSIKGAGEPDVSVDEPHELMS